MTKKIVEAKSKISNGLLVFSLLFLLANCQEDKMSKDNSEFIETLHFQNVDRTELYSISNEQLLPITGEENIHISTMTSDQDDQIYLFEWYSGKIMKFDSELRLLASAGGRGMGEDEFDLENSGVGLIHCDNAIIAHDMNRPNFKIYDTQLFFKQNIPVAGPIWNISCANDGDLLVVYASGNPIEKINLRGEIIKSIIFEDVSTVAHNNLKLLNYSDGRIYTVLAAENLFMIYDLNGALLREIRFPSIENDINKRITAKVLKIFSHNDLIHIVAILNFGLVIHRFTPAGDYITTLVLGSDYINIHQNRDDRIHAIKAGNQQLANYRLD